MTESLLNITFNKKNYPINKEKLITVIEILTNKSQGELISIDNNEITKKMEEMYLYDEVFLENVNRL